MQPVDEEQREDSVKLLCAGYDDAITANTRSVRYA